MYDTFIFKTIDRFLLDAADDRVIRAALRAGSLEVLLEEKAARYRLLNLDDDEKASCCTAHLLSFPPDVYLVDHTT